MKIKFEFVLIEWILFNKKKIKIKKFLQPILKFIFDKYYLLNFLANFLNTFC
jgi:hypothetical protein